MIAIVYTYFCLDVICQRTFRLRADLIMIFEPAEVVRLRSQCQVTDSISESRITITVREVKL